MVEIYGPESSGKTTLTLQVIAEMQNMGGVAAFIDAEHALDPRICAKSSASILTELLISQPDSGEQALDIAETLVRSGFRSTSIVDRLGSGARRLSARRSTAKWAIRTWACRHALMSQALQKTDERTISTHQHMLLIFINQIAR